MSNEEKMNLEQFKRRCEPFDCICGGLNRLKCVLYPPEQGDDKVIITVFTCDKCKKNLEQENKVSDELYTMAMTEHDRPDGSFTALLGLTKTGDKKTDSLPSKISVTDVKLTPNRSIRNSGFFEVNTVNSSSSFWPLEYVKDFTGTLHLPSVTDQSMVKACAVKGVTCNFDRIANDMFLVPNVLQAASKTYPDFFNLFASFFTDEMDEKEYQKFYGGFKVRDGMFVSPASMMGLTYVYEFTFLDEEWRKQVTSKKLNDIIFRKVLFNVVRNVSSTHFITAFDTPIVSELGSELDWIRAGFSLGLKLNDHEHIAYYDGSTPITQALAKADIDTRPYVNERVIVKKCDHYLATNYLKNYHMIFADEG